MISIEIGIQNIGVDAGPFDLYSDVDNFSTAFGTASRIDLLNGYETQAPVDSTIIRVQSTGDCDNYLDIPIEAQPTTTTTTSTTTSTTLPPTTTTTTSTTLPPTTTTTSTTSTTTLNRILTITDVTFDGSQFRVFFEPTNFTLTELSYEISTNNGSSWSTPTLIDTTSSQVFNPGLYSGSFLIRLFDNDSGIVTYSDPFLYTDPTTTSTTTSTTTTSTTTTTTLPPTTSTTTSTTLPPTTSTTTSTTLPPTTSTTTSTTFGPGGTTTSTTSGPSIDPNN